MALGLGRAAAAALADEGEGDEAGEDGDVVHVELRGEDRLRRAHAHAGAVPGLAQRARVPRQRRRAPPAVLAAELARGAEVGVGVAARHQRPQVGERRVLVGRQVDGAIAAGGLARGKLRQRRQRQKVPDVGARDEHP
eukprot:5034879-Prymnesium_polylepis.1